MKYFLRSSAVLCALALMSMVSACGQKGKLIMPPRPVPISTPYPVEQPKPAAPKPSAAEQKTVDTVQQEADAPVPGKN